MVSCTVLDIDLDTGSQEESTGKVKKIFFQNKKRENITKRDIMNEIRQNVGDCITTLLKELLSIDLTIIVPSISCLFAAS